MADITIEIENLNKRYPGAGSYALEDLSLQVAGGEIYGFLGPNGAGKSTTIRLLLNFIQPTSGKARIRGRDIVKDSVAIKRSVGYLAGEVELYPKMTGRQFLDYMAELQPPKSRSYISELTKRFQANLSTRISDLSKGNRQKIGLIQAVMHQPKILILDEPTSGLDPLMQEEFYLLAKELRDAGATLFISSHNLAEVQKMCDRVGFIRDGKLISEQNIAEAMLEAAKTFDITFAEPVPLAELRALKEASLSRGTKRGITVHMHGDLAPLFKVLAKHRVDGITQREVNLEAEFLQFYEEGKK